MPKRKTGKQIINDLKCALQEVYHIEFLDETNERRKQIAQPWTYQVSAADLQNLEEGIRLLERFVNRWPEAPEYARRKRAAIFRDRKLGL